MRADHRAVFNTLLGGPGDHAGRPGSADGARAATLTEILSANGYHTYCVGQWHPSPPGAPGASSRESWPLACGFDRYYGFLGRTNQWCPDLIYDNQAVDPPYAPAEGYHLSRDLAETAVDFIRDGLRAVPGQPWLCYLSFGASSGPHVAPQEWAEAYRGRFETGYDRYREIVLANMKRLGVVPEGTGLARADDHTARASDPGGHLVRPWHTLSDEQKRLGRRLAESAAGLCSFTDQQIGRVFDYLKDSGQLDDTIIVACSANATQAAAPSGPLSESVGPADWPGPARTIGGPGDLADCGHLLAGWARAFGTPYSMPRQSLVGGTAPSPLIISWPRLMRGAADGVRDQYHHAADLVPTILDCAAITPPPGSRDSRPPPPPAGVSMRYTFASPDAPTARLTQRYQTPDAGAFYHEGWKAVAPDAGPDRWRLYHVTADRTETRDVADQYPARTAALAVQYQAATGRPQPTPRPQPNP
ncbi:MAG TPA: sulfatase-like hydrolase/transferase, partial [Streptosporangiaceae bacterium]|nr:sulfatase-like hydrolase/transferase [Streptosporangiaceae bacterium]